MAQPPAKIRLEVECDLEVLDDLHSLFFEAAEKARLITQQKFDHGATVEVHDSEGGFDAF